MGGGIPKMSVSFFSAKRTRRKERSKAVRFPMSRGGSSAVSCEQGREHLNLKGNHSSSSFGSYFLPKPQVAGEEPDVEFPYVVLQRDGDRREEGTKNSTPCCLSCYLSRTEPTIGEEKGDRKRPPITERAIRGRMVLIRHTNA